MPDESTQALLDRLARLERELRHLTAGLALLGIKACSRCQKFFRTSDPGALFDQGTPVCYGCLPEWWQQQCSQLSVKDRDTVERALKMWLLRYHHADVVTRPEKLPKDPSPQLQIVVSCDECHTTGYLEGTRCRFCDGRGTLWIVVR